MVSSNVLVYRQTRVGNIVNILPYFKAFLVYLAWYNSWRRKDIDDIPDTVYRYTFDNTIIMWEKTVLCIKLGYWDIRSQKWDITFFNLGYWDTTPPIPGPWDTRTHIHCTIRWSIPNPPLLTFYGSNFTDITHVRIQSGYFISNSLAGSGTLI